MRPILALLLSLAACSAPDQAPSCGALGLVAACPCPGGDQGAQECGPEGVWGVCVCPSPDAGAADAAPEASRPDPAPTDVPSVDVADVAADAAPDAAAREDAAACPTGRTLCGGRCVDTSNDAANCGGCDRVCARSPERHFFGACEAGRCVARCELNRGDCNSDMGDGCETDLSTGGNCGACGRRCASSSACIPGAAGAFTCR